MNRLSLQWHYRSRHESLITFSNTTYYDSRLVTFPSPVTDDQAVRFERVQGVYDRGGSRTNRAEAEAIVRAVEAHCLDATKAGLSLGVVTFNQPQQALIETLLDARRRASPALDRAIAARASEKLFIKNLENVQGDERDVIFFSITYGADAAGKMTMNFGPLNGEGGHRRLNVAISRARESVVIFSTLMPEQIDLARVRAAGVRDLKHYLEFAIRGARALAQQSSPTGREPDSPFEVAVIAVLRSRGWVVHPQVGCSGYRIDLAVVDPRAPGRYLVGIECDGRAYHSGATARDRDRLRQHVLESLGWKIHRIWSTDWWLNAEGEIAKIDRLLAVLLAEVPAVPELPSPSPLPSQEEAASDAEPGAVPGMTLEGGAKPEAGARSTTQTTTESTARSESEPQPPLRAQPRPQSIGQTPGLPAYSPLPLVGGDPAAFHAPDAAEALSNQLRQVVEVEGPVPEGELFRRVARVWGLERTGARVADRLRALVPGALARTVEPHETFYWPTDADPGRSPVARVFDGSEPSRRHVEEVCVEELGNLALHVLGQAGAAPRQDVARSVCRLLGMARMTAEAERRVDAALDGLVASGRAGEAEGVLRPLPAA
jgi:very-short-patch-repair endonuclease